MLAHQNQIGLYNPVFSLNLIDRFLILPGSLWEIRGTAEVLFYGSFFPIRNRYNQKCRFYRERGQCLKTSPVSSKELGQRCILTGGKPYPLKCSSMACRVPPEIVLALSETV